jgi:hypothetical protein
MLPSLVGPCTRQARKRVVVDSSGRNCLFCQAHHPAKYHVAASWSSEQCWTFHVGGATVLNTDATVDLMQRLTEMADRLAVAPLTESSPILLGRACSRMVQVRCGISFHYTQNHVRAG